MTRIIILTVCLSTVLLFDSCKKEPKQPPLDNGGGSIGTTAIKVVLPQGSNVDLSKTKIWTMSETKSVEKNGSATVPFLTDGCELAYLTDGSENLIMMGFIHKDNKEITIKTTAQVLLFFGLGYNFLPSEARVDFLAQTATDAKLSDYYASIEAAFKTDPLLLQKQGFKNMLNDVFEKIKIEPIAAYGRQNVDIVDDEMKSSLEIEKKDDENININNYYYRRTHAFLYKTAFKDQNNIETVIHTNIDFNDAADKDLKVLKARYTRQETGGNYGTGYKYNKQTTGPIALQLRSSEKEATYKVRILGPGAETKITLTEAEKAKLEELYFQYLAYDQIAPYLLDVTGYRTLITNIDEDNLKPFYDKVKAVALLNKDEIMRKLKLSTTNNIPEIFFSTLDNAGHNRVNLINTLFECFKKQYTNLAFPSAANISAQEKQLNKFLDFTRKLIVLPSDMLIFADPSNFNEMEEFVVKAKDSDVKISPRESDVMAFTNHALTVQANPTLSTGETIEYEWTTLGTFGVLKNGNTEGKTFTTTTNKINYYGKTTPNDNNFERVVVSAYVKNSGGARTKYGSDTATINVKKVKILMKPSDAILSPKDGISSVKLYLINTDGTNPIINNSNVEYRVNWKTAGSYGHFAGGLTNQTTTVNETVYIATDNVVSSASETITAIVEFRISQGSGWSAWMQREVITGKVLIENDLKKKTIWVPLRQIHGDSTYPYSYYSPLYGTINATVNICAKELVVTFPTDPNAKSYSLKFETTATGVPSYSWNAGAPSPYAPAHYTGVKGYDGGSYSVVYSSGTRTSYANDGIGNANNPGIVHVDELGGEKFCKGAWVTIYLKD